VRAELAEVQQAAVAVLARSAEVADLKLDLRETNERLWEVEDDLRQCEAEQDFGVHFITLARSVYRNNDQRAALKRRLNTLLGAPWAEQKCYPAQPVTRRWPLAHASGFQLGSPARERGRIVESPTRRVSEGVLTKARRVSEGGLSKARRVSEGVLTKARRASEGCRKPDA
jgi:hypothetical protein